MKVAVSQAKARLTELVRKAEAGEEVVLTRDGHAVVRLVPERPRQSPGERRAIIERAVQSVRGKITPGPCAARSQDFLYNEDGLPK